ncbi:MAG: response regulator transcription factor [Candidatus Saccharimonas sp.]
MRILIVEDTTHLAEAVAHVLKRTGHEVDIANDGVSGLEYARSGVYDVIVLDNMLPRLTGVEVSQTLRREKNFTPIVMLSAKSEVDDRVDGLNAGSDDYLTKPFKVNELLARIHAVTRRSNYRAKGDNITIGDMTIHPENAFISTKDGEVKLTAKEFLLLEQLSVQAGSIVSKEVLFHRAWGQKMFSEDSYVEVYMSYIRKKLRQINAHVSIKAVRGLGYQLKTEKG